MGECLIIKSGGGTDTSNATATKDTVLQGYSCYAKDVLVNGSVLDMTLMENADTFPGNYPTIPVIDVGPEALNNVWITNNADGIKRFCIRIPKNGYYPTNCFVGIDISLIKNELLLHASQITSGKPATSDKILTGYSGYANGVKIDGTMPDRGAVMYSLPINGSYTIPAGYHNGNGKITQNIATQGGWTVTPGTGNILACAAGRYVTGTIYCAGSGNLVAGNIRNGVNIFGVVGNFVGWVDSSTSIRVSALYKYRANIKQDWYSCTSSYVLLNGFCVKGWNYITVTADNTPDYEDVFKTGMLSMAYRLSTTGSNGMAFVGKFKENWFSGNWESPYIYHDYYTVINARTVQIRLTDSSKKPTAIYALSLGTDSRARHRGIVGTVTFSL